ncbi:hypothetical protein HPB47_007812 [Ixodes persulcatus]|uniref:Uncharacterized protein n=1 Tax=Ixodes persulcatus TaxID=34615 RepID=A0AC60P6Q7_IXOPE|nr:hypothetical protein HPB47_007812 [Ixodes persulcatus]
MGGAGEKTAKKLAMSVLVSKITYAAGFYPLTRRHHNRLKTLLNEARRTILGLPKHTRREELAKCIFIPDIADLIQQQKDAQASRLQHTNEGRMIAKFMGVQIQADPPIPKRPPPWELIDVTEGSKPLPKNMDADRHKKRREHYARQHKKDLAQMLTTPDNMVAYADASLGTTGWATAVTYLKKHATWTVTQGNPLGHHTPEYAECKAVLQAIEGATPYLGTDQQLVLYTDSQEVDRELRQHKYSASPTIKAIFDYAIRLYRNKGARISVRWVPGHEGIPGNELAHEAAQQAMRNLTQPSLQPRPSDVSPADQDTYDPVEELRLDQRTRKRLLGRSWSPEEHPIPKDTFRRKEMVLLRRIRTGGAVTPNLQYKFELYALKKEHPYAVPPDPRCKLCREEDSRPSLHHILWDCEGLKTYRCLIFSKMEQIDRPSNLRDWTHPAGDSQRKTRVLRSLLEYISTGDLTSCI